MRKTNEWEDVELRQRAVDDELADGEHDRLIDLLIEDGEAPRTEWVRKRDQRRVLAALHRRGELRVPQGREIVFECEVCGTQVRLQRARQHLIRWVDSRGYLVCRNCADLRKRVERCSHVERETGRRCPRLARSRAATCGAHEPPALVGSDAPPENSLAAEEVAAARMTARRGDLQAAFSAWQRASSDADAAAGLRNVVRCATAYLHEEVFLAEEGKLPLPPFQESLLALKETLVRGLPPSLSGRIAELERVRQRGQTSPELTRQLALHGLAREPMLTIRFAAFDTVEGPDLTDEEAEAEAEELRTFPKAEKQALLRA